MPETHSLKLPEAIPVYPLKDMVAFPYMVISLYLTHKELPVYEESVHHDNLIVLVKVREGEAEGLAQPLHQIGTVCKISQFNRLPEGGGEGDPRRPCPGQAQFSGPGLSDHACAG